MLAGRMDPATPADFTAEIHDIVLHPATVPVLRKLQRRCAPKRFIEISKGWAKIHGETLSIGII